MGEAHDSSVRLQAGASPFLGRDSGFIPAGTPISPLQPAKPKNRSGGDCESTRRMVERGRFGPNPRHALNPDGEPRVSNARGLAPADGSGTMRHAPWGWFGSAPSCDKLLPRRRANRVGVSDDAFLGKRPTEHAGRTHRLDTSRVGVLGRKLWLMFAWGATNSLTKSSSQLTRQDQTSATRLPTQSLWTF
jgi:hypothetical protein